MVIGVASRQKPAVPGQCNKDGLAFYTTVQDFLPWIKEVTGVTDKTAEGKFYKVNRCLARYSPRATTTNRPINRALNKPGPN